MVSFAFTSYASYLEKKYGKMDPMRKSNWNNLEKRTYGNNFN